MHRKKGSLKLEKTENALHKSTLNSNYTPEIGPYKSNQLFFSLMSHKQRNNTLCIYIVF